MSEESRITVGHTNADLIGNSNEVIQTAVDRVAAVGKGTVHILPGTYLMHDSLHLRSGVHVQGSGDDTILVKTPSVSSPVIYYLGYGHFDVSVAEPDKFRIGMGIRVFDLDSGGFYSTVASIIGMRGNELTISSMLNHDYDPRKNAKVDSVYPVVSGYHLANARISDLAIDGNAAENEYIDGCRGGGVFLLQARDTAVRNISVRNYNGDGISFQQCRNVLIEKCRSTGNKGHGLHPGSGSANVIIRDVTCSDNGMDGIYYCLRVTYSMCEDCTFERNKGNGISIGHRDTDAVIRNNIIQENGRHGVYFRPDGLSMTGHRTVIANNRFLNNCRCEGTGEIKLDCSVEDVNLYRNDFQTDRYPVLSAKFRPNRFHIHENTNLGPESIELTEDTFLEGLIFDKTEEPLSVGPQHAVRASFYHLGDGTNE